MNRLLSLSGAAAALVFAGLAAAQSAPPAWIDAPTFAEGAAAYPARAKAQGVGGFAELTCTANRQGYMRDCAVMREEPDGLGIGAAARKLAEKLRSTAVNGTEVRAVIGFTPDMLKPGGGFAGNPTWAALPAPADFQAAFPKSTGGPNTARVVLDCHVADGGALSACTVESEDPAGQGLGAGALGLAPKFRVGLTTTEGVPTVGAQVRVPIRYQLEQVTAPK